MTGTADPCRTGHSHAKTDPEIRIWKCLTKSGVQKKKSICGEPNRIFPKRFWGVGRLRSWLAWTAAGRSPGKLALAISVELTHSHRTFQVYQISILHWFTGKCLPHSSKKPCPHAGMGNCMRKTQSPNGHARKALLVWLFMNSEYKGSGWIGG